MRRLASQTAAHKLGQILGLLVIPIIVLWSIYFFHAKGEIDGLNREIEGVSRALNYNAAPDKRAAFLKELLRPSGLALDNELESHVLAETGLLLVPSLQQKLQILNEQLAKSVRPERDQDQQGHALIVVAGDAQNHLNQIDERLRTANMRGDAAIDAAFSELQGATTSLEKFVRDYAHAGEALIGTRSEIAALVEKHQNLIDSIGTRLQGPILNNLKSRLEWRRAGAWRELILLTLAGATSALAGIGLAIMMMRSTLRRLDEVELSRAEADDARHEAEQLAARFSDINSDISNLNQELASKVKQLKEVQDALIKKGRLEQLGQLTATIAHEIRNPLGAIRTSAFLLERKTNALGEDVSGHLQRINNGVDRCDTIITQLLDFSRTKEVNSSLALLDDWLAKVVREEAQRLPENVYIECALGLEGIKLPFDAARLQRAVINLLSNASEALSQSESNANKRACIWVTTLRDADFAIVRIADNGPGITLENMQKIREPLFTTKSFGTGLGIPAVEQIVTQHNGRLEIASQPGLGATFTLYLPLLLSHVEAA